MEWAYPFASRGWMRRPIPNSSTGCVLPFHAHPVTATRKRRVMQLPMPFALKGSVFVQLDGGELTRVGRFEIDQDETVHLDNIELVKAAILGTFIPPF